jgi:ATP-dependent DNA helicase RecQ
VVDDVATQLGVTMNILRGPLTRDGLSLQAIDLPDAAERLCWLDRHLGELPGSGIIYCLTVDDTRRVADWLSLRGHSVAAYSGDLENDHRLEAEAALQANEIKALVATTALGMGYDKPDLGFVVHFQAPGSPIAYYQQVGRAGRALDSSVAVLLRGVEDAQIQDWFIKQAFPDERHVAEVLAVFDDAGGPVTLAAVEQAVNMSHSTLDSVLKQLTVEGALSRLRSQTYERTPKPWTYPTERVEAVTAARRMEQQQMHDYATTDSCRMVFLTRLLDDSVAVGCGVCDVCTGPRFRGALDGAEVAAARLYLRQGFITIEPRKRLVGRSLPQELRFETGRALCAWGDRGWGSLVMAGRHEGTRFDDRLIGALVEMIRGWAPDPYPVWIAFVPSLRQPALVADLAQRLGAAIGLPVLDVVRKVRNAPQQRAMHNSAHQYANVDGAFEVEGDVRDGPVLLVDDLVDSRWTLTEVAMRLRSAGAGPVFTAALASTLGRDS